MGTPDRVGTTHTVQLLSAHCLMDKLSSAQRTRSFCPMRQHEHATPPPDKMPPRIKTLGPNSPNLVPSTDLQSPIPPSLLSYSEVSHPPPPPAQICNPTQLSDSGPRNPSRSFAKGGQNYWCGGRSIAERLGAQSLWRFSAQKLTLSGLGLSTLR